MPNTRTLFLAFACLLAATAASAVLPARAQDVRTLSDRIERLQRDVDTLNRQVGGGRSAPFTVPNPPLSAQQGGGGFSSTFIDRTDQRFSELESQVRELTGKIEEMGYRLNEMSTRLDRLAGDLEFRLNAIERGGAGQGGGAAQAAPVAAPPTGARQAAQALPAAPTANPRLQPGEARAVIVPGAPGQAAPPVLLPPGPPEQQFDYAYTQLQLAQRGQTDFDRPEQLLRQFVQQHPTHRLAGNAQYWLGETYYARRDFQRAALTFGEGLTQYPNSDKGPDNLLRLGQSLAALNRNRDACGALGDMERRYPRAPQSVRQEAARVRQRISCG
jgi:tol-pal system protein YbgF